MLVFQSPLFATGSVTLAWDASPDASVTGYRIYYGAASLSYTNSTTVGNVTNATLTGLVAGATYFFAATALNSTNVESGFSNETTYTVSTSATTQAPAITTQPASQSVPVGATVSFTVVAGGTAPLSYQWRLNGANLGGATSATLSFTNVTTSQAGSYSCRVTNAAGSVTSSTATLTVSAPLVAPSITTQPANQSVMVGATVSFAVVASGTAPLSYQWRLNGANLGGATSATLSLTGVTTGQAGSYSCVVTNAVGSVTSSAATLTVGAQLVAPSITTQPASQSVTVGATVSFAVVASGTGPLSYQWRFNGANIGGATNATIDLPGVTTGQAGNYSCFVANAAGSVTSSAATLTVSAPLVAPSITTQPVSQSVMVGATVSFAVVASGTAPLSYQWRFNGANIGGATNATIDLPGVTTAQAGNYSCFVANAAGSVTSSATTLTVSAPPVAPSLTTQPASQSVTAGATVSFAVVASGTAPLSYQWRLNGANLGGATSAMLSLTGVTTGQAGNYSCFVANAAGSVTSSTATLTVITPPVAPSLTTQPASQSVTAGATVSFAVVASGTAPLSYQWRLNGANLGGATSAMLSLTGVTTGQAGNYSCLVANAAGSVTSSAASLTVLAQTSQLSLNQSGSGTITPDLGNASLVVGQSYTLTAKPAAGYVFAGWSGGVQSTSPTLTFIMTAGLGLQANFLASPYVAMAGTYNGLFSEADEVRASSAGAFNIYTDTSGNYSGWLQIGFTRYTVAGQLKLDAKATNTVARWNGTSLTVELRFGQGSEVGQIFGRITDGSWTSLLSGGRAAYQTGGNAPQAGDYTMVFPGQVGDPSLPEGDGFGTLHVGTDGFGTLSGTLADGTSFSQAAWLTAEGEWPLYVSLYAGKGAVISWMTFTNEATSDLNGEFVWVKPADPSTAQYTAGFTSNTKAVGSFYVAPTGTSKALALSTAFVSFTGGNLSTDITNTVTMNAGSQVVNLSPNLLTLTISPLLGSFTGQVVEPGNGVVHPFSGVVLQKMNGGFGFLPGVTRSSRVTVTAAP